MKAYLMTEDEEIFQVYFDAQIGKTIVFPYDRMLRISNGAMTMTSDERIEIAERLRKTHGIMAFVDALGIDEDSDWCWTDVSRRVADLIDPTCHAVHDNPQADDEFICSGCGALVGIEDMFMSNYCEKCGARVVDEDAD